MSSGVASSKSYCIMVRIMWACGTWHHMWQHQTPIALIAMCAQCQVYAISAAAAGGWPAQVVAHQRSSDGLDFIVNKSVKSTTAAVFAKSQLLSWRRVN